MDFKTISQKWQKKWDESKVFEPKVEKRPKFFFTTPYPYISGSLHIGHGRAVTESDVYVRYKRMKGLNTLFPLAFHITGTPVLGIASAIKKGDKKKIELYKGYVRNYIQDEKEVERTILSFQDPWKIVKFFVPKMMDEYKSLGLSIDWTRRFTTGDADYQQFITWQFKKYKELNYLIKGSYPVLYCPADENAVGEDDIQDADTNPVEKQEFTLLKFKMNNREILVAATLRPETVYGQTNLWIRPDIEYVRVNVKGETWIMTRECYGKLAYQKKNIEIIGTIKGTELIGKYAIAPGPDKKIIILPSKFVEPNVGTGIVTSVPSDAPYDYIALQDLQNNPEEIRKYGLNKEEIKAIDVIPIIQTEKYGNEAGVKVVKDRGIKNQTDPKLKEATQAVYKEGFHNGKLLENCGPYAGMKILFAKDKVKKDLIEQNKADLLYEVSREAFCRCGAKVVVAVLDDQWFLDFNANKWKEKAHECLEQMKLIPENSRKLYEDAFEWLDKRPAARRRGIGTPLPFDKNWIIESLSDSTIYMAFYTIKNLINKHKIKPEQLIPEFFEYVYLENEDITKLSEKANISPDILKEFRQNFNYWYPNDHRHTFKAHLSNHLSFFIFAHTGIFPKKYWPKKISLHGFVISEGTKMSKSKGNVISLLDVTKQYGADTFRTYIASATNPEGTFDWRSEEAEKIKKHLENITVLAQELIENKKQGTPSYQGHAIISRLQRYIQEADKALDKMELRDYAHIVIYHIPNLINKAKSKITGEQLHAVYHEIAEPWTKMLAPLIPHIAEELWNKMNKKGFVSTEKWPEADKNKIDLKAETAEITVHNTLSDINHVIKLTKNTKPKKIKLFIAAPWKYKFVKKLREILKQTRKMPEIMKQILTEELKPHAKNITKMIPKFIKDPSKLPEHELDQEAEINSIEEAQERIEQEYKAPIEIIPENESKENKAKNAMPGKPAILLE
ncbi:leucine--tRNA ligase [Candidatus Woesearchaeota archaeon]|nr:leucine--tRNA ligase [Candidatus Woesearchaeota archaeon]